MLHMHTVVFTDRLEAVKAFYLKYFEGFTFDFHIPDGFSFQIFEPRAKLIYLDATKYNVEPTRGLAMRLNFAFPEIERDRLQTEGIEVSEMHHVNWGAHYGDSVNYFEFLDPAGVRMQLYREYAGETRGITTFGDGTEARKAQN